MKASLVKEMEAQVNINESLEIESDEDDILSKERHLLKPKEQSSFIVVSVVDNGVGISKADQKNLFKMFA